jgi:hypothetical protein
MKKTHFIVGVHVTDRVQQVPDVQRIFTEFGCSIKTRIGLHETHETFCSPRGLIVLDLLYDAETCRQFVEKLSALEGLEVKTMMFEHEA